MGSKSPAGLSYALQFGLMHFAELSDYLKSLSNPLHLCPCISTFCTALKPLCTPPPLSFLNRNINFALVTCSLYLPFFTWPVPGRSSEPNATIGKKRPFSLLPYHYHLPYSLVLLYCLMFEKTVINEHYQWSNSNTDYLLLGQYQCRTYLHAEQTQIYVDLLCDIDLLMWA